MHLYFQNKKKEASSNQVRYGYTAIDSIRILLLSAQILISELNWDQSSSPRRWEAYTPEYFQSDSNK